MNAFVSIGRHRALWLAGLWAIVLVLLFLVLRQTPVQGILAVLERLGAAQVMILVLANLTVLGLMALRWWMLVRSLGDYVPPLPLLLYRLAGFGVSYFTPGPQFGGEPLQVHLLHRQRGLPLSTAVSSVFLDRLIDLLANFTFLVIGVIVVLMGGLVSSTWNFIPFVLAGLLLLPLAHMLALWQGRRPLAWLLAKLSGSWPLLKGTSTLALQSEEQIGLLCRTKPLIFVKVIAISGLIWAASLFEFWLTLRFLGVSAGLVETVSALTAARLAFLLPLPGGLGALEAGQALASQLLGWGPAVGIAISLVIRARDVFLALLGLWIGGFVYRSVLIKGLAPEERS